MQTFLPYPDFKESARVLDRQRLGKQRVEVLQLLKASVLDALGTKAGWVNHPARLMWANHLYTLAEYGLAVCDEWIGRGYKDTTRAKIYELQSHFSPNPSLPEWLGDEGFHRSHRSNLLRKFPEHYSQFWPDLRSDLPYIWPASKDARKDI